ncbi:hypothetical protein AGDE_12618 [Angomonas deanei]|uniref:Uncharacterized protein n=1 Tax=Angomonas deanei TaxID=59799 RepID=A0A7G2C8D1_9TRYP|nr:hypothetical protein AGDE_12618 [Angomonas deanei]CAD2215067.1 hypothetical protein, conserved [Angomonas deanei]|eukprot:EPY23944.1 hypothetical protein AGDE_12618 [Angomonas deanei]
MLQWFVVEGFSLVHGGVLFLHKGTSNAFPVRSIDVLFFISLVVCRVTIVVLVSFFVLTATFPSAFLFCLLGDAVLVFKFLNTDTIADGFLECRLIRLFPLPLQVILFTLLLAFGLQLFLFLFPLNGGIDDNNR